MTKNKFWRIIILFITLSASIAHGEDEPENKFFTRQHAEGALTLLGRLVDRFPPESHIIVYSGSSTAVHAMTARLTFPEWDGNYFFYHNLRGFHRSDHDVRMSYIEQLLELGKRHGKRIVLLRQLDGGGVLSRLYGIITSLEVPDIQRKLVLAGIFSNPSYSMIKQLYNVTDSSRNPREKFMPTVVDIYQKEFERYTDLGRYHDDDDHPSNLQPEMAMQYHEWFRAKDILEYRRHQPEITAFSEKISRLLATIPHFKTVRSKLSSKHPIDCYKLWESDLNE